LTTGWLHRTSTGFVTRSRKFASLASRIPAGVFHQYLLLNLCYLITSLPADLNISRQQVAHSVNLSRLFSLGRRLMVGDVTTTVHRVLRCKQQTPIHY